MSETKGDRMELQLQPVEIPEKISFNYFELKTELEQTLKRYETMVYTPEQLKVAKADRASLNKLKRALNDERIKREREYMRPFDEFKAQINELISTIDKPIELIDSQVKEFEEQKRDEKLEEIEKIFSSVNPHEWLTLDKILKPEWLNASFGIKAVEAEIKKILSGITEDIATLAEMPAYAFEATVLYKQTLSIKEALNESIRLSEIARLKKEAEERKQETVSEPDLEFVEVAEKLEGVETGEPEKDAETAMWVSFSALLTVSNALKLKEFFEMNGIEFKPIKGEN